jgi:hypothetical protein
VSSEVEFNVDFFEVRFVVRAGIKSNDLHLPGFRRIDGKKQGAQRRKMAIQRSTKRKVM